MTRQRRLNRNAVQSASAFVIAEALEQRQLLSVTASTLNPAAHPVDGAYPASGDFPEGTPTPSTSAFSPTQIEEAYGISGISFNGTVGTGAGQTIAIVVANDNPNLVDSSSSSFSTSDLAIFDAQYGLPNPTFTKYYQVNSTSTFTQTYESSNSQYPQPDDGWANEAALDVEWTHAMAPDASIDLVEADTTNLSDLIEQGAVYAANLPNVSVVSMSFAVNEFYGETAYDSYLSTPVGHNGVTFVAASGDNGDVGGYPAFSPNVVAVGATTLTLDGNSYGSEVGLNTSGGGISQYESKPSYQFGETKSSSYRTIPDVSLNGDKNTGISVYDSYNGGQPDSAAGTGPWYKIGGTSASTPIWSALIAITDQGRAVANQATMDGVSQTLPRLYSLNSSDFHDVTTGNNGFAAGTGYDLVTGLGTPIANKLVPDLAGGNKLSGTVFADTNGNGVMDSGETGLSGYTVFLDLYDSGVEQGADPSTVSGSDGTFQFTDLAGGTYRLSQAIPAGVDLTTSSDQTVTLGFDSTVTGKNVGFKPTGSAAQLAFSQQPTTVIVGTAITPAITVDIEDASGGIVTSDDSAVTLSVASGGGSLGGTLTVNAQDGVATFSNITITTEGSESIKATDGSLTSVTSNVFTVNPVPPLIGNPAQLAFAQQPFPVTQGSAISPAITVQVEDSKGNVVTTDSSAVTLSIASGPTGGVLGGTLTVNASSGIATFTDVTASVPGTYMLTATDGSLTTATSSSFVVSAIVYIPAKLVITQQPSTSYIGSPISPALTVNVEDPNGVLVTSDSSAVSIAIASGPAGGVLGGTTSTYAVDGVATFSDLTVSIPGSYTLTATDGALTPATSIAFSSSIKGTLAPTILKSTLPLSAVGGSKVHATVSINATNLATTTTTGTVITTIYASENGALVSLGSVTKKMKVAVGKTYPISVPIKLIPASLSGTYSLVATVTDTAGHSYTSPALAGTSLKVALPYIALSPTVSKLTLPASVVGDSKTSAVAVIEVANSGNITAAGTTTIGLYSAPAGASSGAAPIATLNRKLSIAPGKSVAVTLPLKMIPATLSGSYDLYAQVTDPNAVVTTSATAGTVNVSPAHVSFTVSDVSATPSVITTGTTVEMTFTVANTGNIASTGPATITLGISSDGISMLSQLTTLGESKSIAPGKSTVLKFRFKYIVAASSGSFYPFVTFEQDGISTNAAGTTMISIG